VASALAAVTTDLVAIHDAARPLVTPSLIGELVAALEADPEAAGVIAATPVTDTIKRAPNPSPTGSSRHFASPEEDKRRLGVVETLDRGELWAAQTPQVFRCEALRAALAAASSQIEATDEAMLIEAAGGRVLIYPAPPENLKVTTPLDLGVAESLLEQRRAG
jgi:2-C-methyl-D-erythritol 4-phosphate cytidylyltransferase